MQLNDPKLFRQQAYINGKWSDADSGETAEVTNPSNNEVIGTVPNMGPPTPHGRHGGQRPRRNAPTSCAAGTT